MLKKSIEVLNLDDYPNLAFDVYDNLNNNYLLSEFSLYTLNITGIVGLIVEILHLKIITNYVIELVTFGLVNLLILSVIIFLCKEIIKMAVIKKLFFYGFALFLLTSIIYGMAYDFMTGAEIHYDFYGAGFVAWLVFFGILKEIFGL